MKTCKNCNSRIEDDALVCPNCGCVVKGKEKPTKSQSRGDAIRNLNRTAPVPKNKNNKWIWILGWILVFPIPLTILMCRSQKASKTVKIASIAGAWIIYLAIAAFGGSDKSEIPQESIDSARVSIAEGTIDYPDAETFEKALNKKEDVVGKTVRFDVLEYVPDSSLGINCWSGEHLNFISKEELNVSKGQYITGIVTKKPSKKGVSWKIPYEVLEVVDEDSVQKPTNIESLKFSDTIDVTVKLKEHKDAGTVNVKTISDKDFSIEDVVIVSENPEIATVNFKAVDTSHPNRIHYVVVGINVGETNVYVMSKDGLVKSEMVHVIVPKPIEVEKISTSDYKDNLIIGEVTNAKADISPFDAENKNLTWSSSDEKVVKVDNTGIITAVGGGTATITVKAVNEVSTSFDVSVDANKALMNVHESYVRLDDVNIGDDWEYEIRLNGEYVPNTMGIAVGEKLNFQAKFTEDDENPDRGSAKESHVVTKDDIANGFAVSMDVFVKENGGKNRGKKAHFKVTYTFSPVE